MRERETVCLTDMAAAYAMAYPVAIPASVRAFLRERGLEATECRVGRLFDRLLCAAFIVFVPHLAGVL